MKNLYNIAPEIGMIMSMVGVSLEDADGGISSVGIKLFVIGILLVLFGIAPKVSFFN